MEIILQKPLTPLQWSDIRKLYRNAFPREERKPFAAIRRMYQEGKADIWYIQADGRFAGLATTVNGGEMVLLDYFAVKQRRQGKGIGTAAMECLLQLYPGKGVFLEIENTETPGLDQDQRRKRKEFYLSCGFRELGVRARVFGVAMELLVVGCEMDYEAYRKFYGFNMSPWAADHLEKME